MDRDLETFLTALYVIVEDFSQRPIAPQRPACGGPAAQRSDSAVLCLGVAAQWRSGVPWKSARGLRRYVRKHLGPWCPTGRTPSAFPRRLRRLWGAFLLLPDAVAEPLGDGGPSHVMEGCPRPVAHGARSVPPGWFADIARLGTGGNARYFYGVRMLMGSNPHGVATGWTLASGHGQARWVAEVLCSTRAGVPGGQGPRDAEAPQPTMAPPREWRAVLPRGGALSPPPILTERGFRGEDGLTHWASADGVHVCPPPKAAARAQRRGWSAARQGVETAWAHVRASCGLKYPGAHSSGGLLRRVAAKVAA